jgi:hypothetical protein
MPAPVSRRCRCTGSPASVASVQRHASPRGAAPHLAWHPAPHGRVCLHVSNPGLRHASPTSARCCNTRLQATPPPRTPHAPLLLKVARKPPTAAALTPRLPKKKSRTSERCLRPSLSPPPPPLPLPTTKLQSSSSRHSPPPPLPLPPRIAVRSPPAPPASKTAADGALQRARAAWTRRGSARATLTTCRIRESGSIYNARPCRCMPNARPLLFPLTPPLRTSNPQFFARSCRMPSVNVKPR